MTASLDIKPFRITGKKPFKISKSITGLPNKLYASDADLKKKLLNYQDEIDELQQKMYAEGRQSLLIIFQAMDAAGKDGTIRHVLESVNPAGVEIQSFKKPSEEELAHDFLWRCAKVAPQRGHIGIFNRSYYEEVLVCKVHPEIVTEYQKLPTSATDKLPRLWEKRLEDISNYEAFLNNNGTTVIKFFLNVSKAEQKKRFLERIDTKAKNWKFNLGDVKERAHWDEYMAAYEDAINATATKNSPWYAIPADDKGNMRLLVSEVILRHLKDMGMEWPVLPKDQVAGLAEAKAALLAEK